MSHHKHLWVQTTFLEAQMKDGKLDRTEDRQKVPDVFTKETQPD